MGVPTPQPPDHHHLSSLPVSSEMTSPIFYEMENINSSFCSACLYHGAIGWSVVYDFGISLSCLVFIKAHKESIICFDSLPPSQQFICYVGMGLPGLN